MAESLSTQSPPSTITEKTEHLRSIPASGSVRANMASKLMTISTNTILSTSATTIILNNDDQLPSSSGSVSSPSSSNSPSSLSPVTPAANIRTDLDDNELLPLSSADLTTTIHPEDNKTNYDNSNINEESSIASDILEAVTATLHKKDSGTSMGSSVTSSPYDPPPLSKASHFVQTDGRSCPTSPTELAPVSTGTRRFSQPDTISPAGRVLTRPHSTSKLSSIPHTAPHILPNQRYAGFNLAAFGQLSPSASTATMTISRADSSQNPYFGISAAAMRGGVSTPNSLMEGIMSSHSGMAKAMCGSDTNSILDLDDSHNDFVMIDSNGNSSGGAAVGSATVIETIASASAIVSNHHPSTSHHHTLGGAVSELLTTAAVSSASLLTGGGLGGGNGNSTAGSPSTTAVAGSAFSSGLSNNSQPRSSLPSLTSQARKDVMQRAAMLAAMQQNGGAKILGAHRVRRRQDRPNRKIRFGDFHKICEIEYGFDQGKPLVANGRTLVYSTIVRKICNNEEREEHLYLFTDVLVTGTKIRKGQGLQKKNVPDTLSDSTTITETHEKSKVPPIEDISSKDDRQKELESTVEKSKVERVMLAPTAETEMISVEVSVKESQSLLNNPYAGYLENQQISRLTQVQADIVEGEERPMLKVSMPQSISLLVFESTAAKDKFVALLTETIHAYKHYLLSQSKYLADLKKFKRHSAFSFDTSFLKTWSIPGGLNLGSLKPAVGGGSSSNGHGAIGPNTFISSPVASPGGGIFDPYQHQQHLNRPQSMAGSLFGFALNGGHFHPFSDHSKESSYATLRGANAINALQYHHHQQQLLQQQLQNRLSTSSIASGRTGIDRTSSGSTFDALWFMKGASSYETIKNRKSIIPNADNEKDASTEGETSSLNSVAAAEPNADTVQSTSLSSAESASLAVNTSTPQTKSGYGRSTVSTATHSSLLSSASSGSIATLRNGAGWVRDEDATYCMVCLTTKFGVLIRKHHCRLCGRVICWKCCQMKDAVLLNNVLSSGEQGLSPAEIAAMTQEFRKPIRVCLDCIEQNASLENNQTSQLSSPQQQQANSPLSSSFPLQGVFGKFMSSTMTSSPQIMATATNATGSTFSSLQGSNPSTSPFQQQRQRMQGSAPSPLYPRINTRNGSMYPHQHRASLYRIDVERVGEEDEEEDEEDKNNQMVAKKKKEEQDDDEEEEQEVEELLKQADAALEALTQKPEDIIHPSETKYPITDDRTIHNIIKSRHGSVRLKDLDPADINEEEVNNQIMNLESEVESLLIQNAAVPLIYGRSAGSTSRHQREGGTGAGKTRVIRGLPKEMMIQNQRFYAPEDEGGEDDGDDDEEEVSMEELLAQQDEQLKRILA
ncbi:hypothetical protein FBU30_005706 [Linnemannia zychae]|nr:hypothetical protein FBU30_005706 [Linnemannia zychae]